MFTKENRANIVEFYKEIGLNITKQNTVLNASNEEVCNFILNVEGQKKIEGKYYLLVNGIGINDRLFPSILLDIENIQKCIWVAKYFGFEYYVNKKNIDDFMSIIRHLCKYASTKTVYNYTGWIIEDDKWSYLHANGCIGDANVEVEFEESINNYRLPNKIENLKKACELSLQLTEILEDDKGIILQSLVYLSPLVDIINKVSKPPEMVVWFGEKQAQEKHQ